MNKCQQDFLFFQVTERHAKLRKIRKLKSKQSEDKAAKSIKRFYANKKKDERFHLQYLNLYAP